MTREEAWNLGDLGSRRGTLMIWSLIVGKAGTHATGSLGQQHGARMTGKSEGIPP
jgi:hypothetical protein